MHDDPWRHETGGLYGDEPDAGAFRDDAKTRLEFESITAAPCKSRL